MNLERSYQICQAVIQNSPNRDQLRCQLKPPPSMLNNSIRGAVSTKPTPRRFTPPPLATVPTIKHQPNQVMVRHVFNQGIPVNMAVLPHPEVIHYTSKIFPPSRSLLKSYFCTFQMMETRPSGMGQYILVQRTSGVAPRASSAPPSNNPNMVICNCMSCKRKGAFVSN